MDCINLKQRFGSQFRVAYEQSHFAERGEGTKADDPWLQVLLCRHGHIYPQGGDVLAASTDKRGPVASALAELECTSIIMDGDDGFSLAFHVDNFEKIAELLRPRRKRQVSEQERARLAEMGRANLNRYRYTNVGAPGIKLESLQSSGIGVQAL